ncbi:ABC transporter substrate-binding protein [Rhodococcus sp. NPDC060176]|uniref:ABC transporter substrate-binding protein n=1 Tax=Rhodococcus sp. NPDC060176 TaxID=3347062 RepID=UPI003662D290
MSTIKRTAKMIALSAVPVVALAACGGGSSSSAGGGGADDLSVAINLSDMSSLDLARVSADRMLAVVPLFGETLVDLDPADPTKLVPGLATHWETNADASSATFDIREGVTFSSGNPLTAQDVKFSLDRVKNIQGAPSDKLQAVTDIQVLDDHKVRVDLKGPDSSFVASTGTLFFAILDSKEVTAHGGTSGPDASSTDQAQAFLDANTAGTGPYVLKEWKRNQQAVFEANPNYWGLKPTYKTITLLDIRDSSTQSQLIRRGDVDIALDIDADTADSITGSAGIEVLNTPSFNLIYMALNNASGVNPQLANPIVRQAIQKVIDYKGISDGLAKGSPRPAAVVPLGFQGASAVDPIQTDVEGAKKLMSESGVGGFKVDVQLANIVQYGIPLTTLWEKLKSDLAQIDIDLTLQPTEYESWVSAYRDKKIAMTSSFFGPDFFDSSNFFDPFGRNDGNVAKRMSLNLPAGQPLFDQYLRTVNPAERDKVAAQLVTAMRDDATFIPIVQPNKVIVYRDSLRGVAYSPNKNVTLLDVTPA